MSRWEPHTGERLQEAALELFERGYDNTTAAEIAGRAGTAKSTFFRLFTDKREVLFAGTGVVADRCVDAIDSVAPGTTTFGLLEAVLGAIVPAFEPEKRLWYARRQAVIDDNPELRERELLKRQAQSDATTAALRARGWDGLAADVVTALIGVALHTIFTRWIEGSGDQDITSLAADVLAELRTAVAVVS